jgi:hypothetical protein
MEGVSAVTDEEIYEAVLKTILRDTNAGFWKALQHRFEWLYNETYHSIENDPHVLPDQRLFKLLDSRFYLAETTLARIAKENRLIVSPQKISINHWRYVLVRGGGICLVQSYVQSPAELARPAKFREAHAAINGFVNSPQLPLSDVVPEVFDIAKVNGILTHGPIGKEFTEQSQNLAFLNFTVPDNSYSVVSINIPVLEIIDRFDRAEIGTEVPQRDIAQPRIKRPAAKKIEAKDSR